MSPALLLDTAVRHGYFPLFLLPAPAAFFTSPAILITSGGSILAASFGSIEFTRLVFERAIAFLHPPHADTPRVIARLKHPDPNLIARIEWRRAHRFPCFFPRVSACPYGCSPVVVIGLRAGILVTVYAFCGEREDESFPLFEGTPSTLPSVG